MSSAPQLNYAPRNPAHRRVSRWIVIVSILLACIASSLAWLPTEWRRIQLLYWQNRCLAYIASADHLVLDPHSFARFQSPPEWTKFYSIYSPPGFRSAGTLFLHQLTNPKGERRLVALDLDIDDSAALVVYPRVFAPGNLLRGPCETKLASSSYEIGIPSATLFAGIPDPADPSHFTFRAKLNDTVVTFDGWLGNDDRVVIGQRKIAPSSK